MTQIEAVSAIVSSDAAPVVQQVQASNVAGSSAPGFGEMLSTGMAQLEAKIDHANSLVRNFAIDDSVPVHEVTIALEEARLSIELAMQIRNRVVETYREMMGMQL